MALRTQIAWVDLAPRAANPRLIEGDEPKMQWSPGKVAERAVIIVPQTSSSPLASEVCLVPSPLAKALVVD